jgi:hypothetical protein
MKRLSVKHVGTAAPGLAAVIMRAGNLLWAALREIFDEAAYNRFLDRRQLTSSREAYAAFWHEYDATKARRPRCC